MVHFTDTKNYFFSSFFSSLFLLIGSAAFSQTVDSVHCISNFQHLLITEDSTIVSAKFITKSKDGNFLVPGYYYPNTGFFFSMPYLMKCAPNGKVLWSKSYPSRDFHSSNWLTATRIKELHNGDLLMVGEVGIPGTDNRREMALWRLDGSGNLIWSESYESSLWTNPITGATEVTGIDEDASGNIFLSGNLEFFNVPGFTFLLKMNSTGDVLWDKSYGTYRPLSFGSIFLKNKMLLIGRSGSLAISPNINSDLLWCLIVDPADGSIINTKAWFADFNEKSSDYSFGFANPEVTLLDNGQIGVAGTANSDYLAYSSQSADTVTHAIVANFTQDFDFANGVMLKSKQLSNYYNSLVTEHSNGRISYTRFSGDYNLFNENIVYGKVQGNHVTRERMYLEQNRTAATVSNFLFYQPSEDILVQSYTDSTGRKGGLELITLGENDAQDNCNGFDTGLTFVQPYLMKGASIKVDSIESNTFRFTNHIDVSQGQGHLATISACEAQNTNIHIKPVVNLDKALVLCKGSSHQLDAGAGYNQYLWSTGSTSESVAVSDTGTYWVSVIDRNGCEGSDTTIIANMLSTPTAFLPHDTAICARGNLTITPSGFFETYLWNDLSNAATLTVTQPGTYWLQVTDSNNCVGTDTIQITAASCASGLHVPSGFTPNGDGLNDLLTPLLSGDVIKFRFCVYNRWGEKVFETQALRHGWDGKWNGKIEASGVFVWLCDYQLAGNDPKIERGTVTLIR